MNSDYCVLIKWADGRTEQHDLPECGPEAQTLPTIHIGTGEPGPGVYLYKGNCTSAVLVVHGSMPCEWTVARKAQPKQLTFSELLDVLANKDLGSELQNQRAGALRDYVQARDELHELVGSELADWSVLEQPGLIERHVARLRDLVQVMLSNAAYLASTRDL